MKHIISLLAICCLMLGAVGVHAAEAKSSGAKSTVAALERVNINTADAETLASNLKNVGAKKAEAIIEYRNTIGKFTAKEQLLDVKGIGQATLEQNKDRIVF